jgi:hypothetical protein
VVTCKQAEAEAVHTCCCIYIYYDDGETREVRLLDRKVWNFLVVAAESGDLITPHV